MCPPSTHIQIRRYRSGDAEACRALWRQLTEFHRRLYGAPVLGGRDPGSGFDEHVARAGGERIWLAVADGDVVGLAATIDQGPKAELEPVVVAERLRRRGIGRMLVQAAVSDALERGAEQVFVRPVGRNGDAIRFFQSLGFDVLTRVELASGLTAGEPRRQGERLAGCDLRT